MLKVKVVVELNLALQIYVDGFVELNLKLQIYVEGCCRAESCITEIC